jgi:hypothetical protein
MAIKNYILIGLAVLIFAAAGILAWMYSGGQAPQEPANGGRDQVPIQAEYESKVVYTTSQENADEAALRRHCDDLGGEFNTCGSACAPDAATCVQVCAYTCELSGKDENGEDLPTDGISMDTANWSEYTNQELGFSVKYPPELDLEENQARASFVYWGPTQREGTELYDGISFTVSHDVYSSEISLEQYIGAKLGEAEITGEIIMPMATTTLGGVQGYSYTISSLGEITHIIVPVDDNQVLDVHYLAPDPGSNGFQEAVGKLLGTFEILPKRQKTIQVDLYYFNQNRADQIGDPCNPAAVRAVSREIPITQTPIQDTIRLLIQGKLAQEEEQRGFSTNFPGEGFELTGANLEDGALTLAFDDPNNFTSGGSCRVGILKAQIERTAQQFTEVDEIRFQPETLFQP